MEIHDKTNMLAEVLVPLSLHYPQTGYTPAQLSVLADDWCEDLADFPFWAIRESVRQARRNERFFPGVSVIREYAAIAVEDHFPPRLSLPEATHSPEEQYRSAVSAAMLAASFRDFRAKDFFSASSWPEKEAIARQCLGTRYPEAGDNDQRGRQRSAVSVASALGIVQ